ncbi:hypothetical protein N2152v2_007107 [Parachlorella kessleri]
MEAPVIDAQQFLSTENNQTLPPSSLAHAIAQAARDFGFCQLVNHGLSIRLLDELEVKRTQDNPNGYFNDEFTKQALDLKEGFDCLYDDSIAGEANFVAPNQWPEGQVEFRRVLQQCMEEMSRASFKLLEALSLGLDLPPDTLRPFFQGHHTSFLRLNFYPATPEGKQGLGVHHHTDAGFLTILVQDPEVPGLEFFKEGRWHLVTPIRGALTINVGDQAQVLTNDLIKAPLHRVRATQGRQPRYSAPFFFNPRVDAVTAPLPGCVTAGRPAVYQPIPWKEFREKRFAGDYADLGEEVQISHWKVQH